MITIKKLVIILTISILIILSGCWAVPDPPDPPEPNGVAYRALLVGVGDYMFYGDLKSPEHNVAKIKGVLEDCRFTEEEIRFTKIETLLDLNATKENILQGIVDTFIGADENDVSYFYWNGHGGSQIEPHICPSDYNGSKNAWISVHELEEALSAIPGTKVVIMDTCYSGGFIGKARDFALALLTSDKYQVITSCRGDQVCYENRSAVPPYCYFTMGVYQACRNLRADDNEDGIIDLTELWDYAYWWALNHGYKCFNQYAQYFPEGSTFPIVEY